MALPNYTSKDAEAFFADMIAAVPQLAPDWTNLNEGDMGVALLRLMAATADQLTYLLDRATEESFLPTAQTREAVQRLCRLIDYRLSRPVAAKTLLKFSVPAALGADVLIPAYTTCRTAEGLFFTTRAAVTLFAGQMTVTIEAYQGRYQVEPFLGTGGDVQAFTLSRPNLAQNFLDVVVDAQRWEEDTHDTPNTESSVYEVRTDANEYATLVFLNSLGTVPPAGASILAHSLQTDGVAGNIGSGLVNTIISTLVGGGTLTVTNMTPASGGRDRETVADARHRAPRQLRSGGNAVTLQDYVDQIELFPGVAKAQAINHSGYMEGYVALDGGARLFVRPPQVTVAAVAGAGTLPTDTYYVRVTALDAFGETATWEFNPSDRATLVYEDTVGVTLGEEIAVTIPHTDGATAFRIYVGTASGVVYVSHDIVAAPAGDTVTTVTVLPVSTTLPPTENTTGARADASTTSVKQELDAYLELRRTLCTVFALYNPTRVPIDITATVKAYDNYRQSAVAGAVQSALTAFFDAANAERQFGETLHLSSLYGLVRFVDGVQAVTFDAPLADTVLSAGELATLGVVTLTMVGGSV